MLILIKIYLNLIITIEFNILLKLIILFNIYRLERGCIDVEYTFISYGVCAREYSA
jgi:hypothetical protein